MSNIIVNHLLIRRDVLKRGSAIHWDSSWHTHFISMVSGHFSGNHYHLHRSYKLLVVFLPIWELSYHGFCILRIWIMMPRPPFAPLMPLESHFNREWCSKHAGLSGLSFNHKWDPSFFFICYSTHLQSSPLLSPSPSVGYGQSAVSAFSPHLSAFMLFQPIADQGHQFHWVDSFTSLKTCRIFFCSTKQGR